jgi:bacterial/archaeal transporter family protein
MWWIYALLSAFFAALTAIFGKIGVKNVDTDLATAIRTVVILVLAWGIVSAKGSLQSINSLSKANWIFLSLSGLATGLSWIFYFKALQAGKVSQVAPLDKISIVFTIILSALILGEPLTVKTSMAIVLIVAGSLILVL